MTFSLRYDVNHAPLLLVQSAAPSQFERVVDVMADLATIVIALALIAVGVAVIYGALKARRMMKAVRADFAPAIRNVNLLSDRVRAQAEELSATVSETNVKVRRATEMAEARLRELDALAGVMQAEAESAFVRAASTVRGVHAGTRALRRLAARGDETHDGELDALLDDEGMDEDDETEMGVMRPGRRGRHVLD